MQTGDRFLLLGGGASGVASILHVAIIFGGPDWYRFFGAGERMAHLAARGSAFPVIITAGIAFVLSIWMLYAFSGAGLIRRLPFLRLALILISAAYLTRGILGIPAVLIGSGPYAESLRSKMTFMIVSSAICVCLGLCYATGAVMVWRQSTDDHARGPQSRR